jgi:hypothetical protein
MQPMKVDILLELFCYAGTADSSVNPQLAMWLAKTVHQLKIDPRVGRVGIDYIDECPTDYARDIALGDARDAGFDILLMLDADNWPDARVGTYQDAVPFMDVGFTLAYDRLLAGKPTLVAAPYCSGPSSRPSQFKGEVPFVAHWERISTEDPHSQFKIGTVSRQEAALLRGLHRVPAIATGVCLMSTNIVDGMPRPWFYYEFDPKTGRKVSTEDCVFSRNVGMTWLERINEHVVFLAADSWAYHRKPKWVGKPELMTQDDACESYRRAVLSGVRKNQRIFDVGAQTGEALLEPKDINLGGDVVVNYGCAKEQMPFDVPGCEVCKAPWTEDPSNITVSLYEEDEEPPVPDHVVDAAVLVDPVPDLEEVTGNADAFGKAWAKVVKDASEADDAQAEEREPGILSLLFAGRRIFYADSHPLAEDTIRDMRLLYESVRPSRMMVSFSGMCEAVAVFSLAAKQRQASLSVFCRNALPIKAAQANIDGISDPQYARMVGEGVPPLDTLPPQDLDMIWLGYPPDPVTAMQEIKAVRRHLRKGGVLAGPINADTELALNELGIQGLVQWIDAGPQPRVWYITRPVGKGERA